HNVGIGRVIQPAAALDEFLPEISQVRVGPTERRQAQPQERPTHLGKVFQSWQRRMRKITRRPPACPPDWPEGCPGGRNNRASATRPMTGGTGGAARRV